MNEHETIGRQLMQIQQLEQQANMLIGVIRALKNGEMGLDRIELHDEGFSVTEVESPEKLSA